jgi:predicted Fe-S protein YdhL (DUF1289 family)
VCKYKLRGHCIGCAMTKLQRDSFKRLSDDADRRAFVRALLTQQRALGDRFRGWATAYRAKCARKQAPCLLDETTLAE